MMSGIPTSSHQAHYLIYDCDPSPPENEEVLLHTDFEEKAGIPATVTRLTRFANPAWKQRAGTKSREEIVDPDAHLSWYRLKWALDREPIRQVTFENQFGKQTWVIGSPRFLVVPAQKHPHKEPVGLNHYKAYRVLGVKNGWDPLDVTVGDQFVASRQVHVGMGRFFCMPVRKKHQGRGDFPIQQADRVLAVYDISEQLVRSLQRNITDQFRDNREIAPHTIGWLGLETDGYEWKRLSYPKGQTP